MWSFDRKNGLTLLTRNGMPDEEIIGLEKSNNVNCIKIHTFEETKIYRLEKFDSKCTQFATRFKSCLNSRSSFVEMWKCLHTENKNKEDKIADSGVKDKATNVKEQTETKKKDQIDIDAEKKKKDQIDIDAEKKKKDQIDIDAEKKKKDQIDIDAEKNRATNAKEQTEKKNRTDETDNNEENMKDDALEPKERDYQKESSDTCDLEQMTEETDTESDTPEKELSFEERIQRKFKGNLKEPSSTNLVRVPDESHTKQLEKEFRRKPFNYYTLMVVNIPGLSDIPDNIQTCKLETIGGNHSRIALKNILKDKELSSEERKKYEERLCAVYCSLTPQEAKRVGLEHNTIHRFGKDIDIFARIECFRSTLFQRAGFNKKSDIQTKETPVDKNLLNEWKNDLEMITGVENRKKLNNKFRFELFLAQFSTPCWLQLRSFIDNFKGSKRKQKNKISGRQLRCLDGLKEKTILDLLQKNNNQHVDFCKFKAMCDEHKSKSSSVTSKGKHKATLKNAVTEEEKTEPDGEERIITIAEEDVVSESASDASEREEYKLLYLKNKTHLDDSLKKINVLHKENTSMKQKYAELKNSFEQEKLSSQNCKCEADTLKKEVSDLKKKLGNIFKENKELKEDINKRKLASVTDFCASTISVDLNPSPRKKLCTENNTDTHDGKRKRQMNEENTEYKDGEKVLCFWKQDQKWYEADIIEKRSKGYFVKFVLDGVERVLKQKDIKKKKTGKR
ncbi:uncharacterized protein LOC143051911 isoform X2 [Mytilus galloprovincialis]|uniref:uncharacterized protein LOC143051911 isoform X2 n=1 Tax=Mytilus galloprovincialis TaxID=29158 RepID=UPI003F7C9381